MLKFVLAHPYIIPNSINMAPLAACPNHIRMIPVKTDKASIFKRMGDEFKKMFKLISPGKLIKSILWGENLILLMKKLLHILQNEEMNQNSGAR